MAKGECPLESVGVIMEKQWYQGKKVFITGHTGFKGAWLSFVLLQCGADVSGFSLDPVTTPSLFHLLSLDKEMESKIGDIRNRAALASALKDAKPDIVFHLAAQPLVKKGYEHPVETFETNIMGTVHLLEEIRGLDTVHSVVNVTTDKVYENKDWCWGYREHDILNGFDPYSNSKSCSELVTSSYWNSFFQGRNCGISTMRAGNVIGGGDFSDYRIIPDCVQSAIHQKDIPIRNPHSIRPYQHVLEPVYTYLSLAQSQYQTPTFSSYNIGPLPQDCVTTESLVTLFCQSWGENIQWTHQAEENPPHESHFLKLDCEKLKSELGITPKLSIKQGIDWTVEWSKIWHSGGDVRACCEKQWETYLTLH